jgi:hypothetical protein
MSAFKLSASVFFFGCILITSKSNLTTEKKEMQKKVGRKKVGKVSTPRAIAEIQVG